MASTIPAFAPVSVADALRRNDDYIKIAVLKEREEPFYVGNFVEESSERGRSKTGDDGPRTIYVFSVYDREGVRLGTSSTGTAGLMDDIDKMASVNGPDAVYGPVKIIPVGKAFRFAPAE